MATGGIFTIITNDGKQDRMLMATALLHERLRAINVFKLSQNGGKADDYDNLPTLLDIEKTHILNRIGIVCIKVHASWLITISWQHS